MQPFYCTYLNSCKDGAWMCPKVQCCSKPEDWTGSVDWAIRHGMESETQSSNHQLAKWCHATFLYWPINQAEIVLQGSSKITYSTANGTFWLMEILNLQSFSFLSLSNILTPHLSMWGCLCVCVSSVHFGWKLCGLRFFIESFSFGFVWSTSTPTKRFFPVRVRPPRLTIIFQQVITK